MDAFRSHCLKWRMYRKCFEEQNKRSENMYFNTLFHFRVTLSYQTKVRQQKFSSTKFSLLSWNFVNFVFLLFLFQGNGQIFIRKTFDKSNFRQLCPTYFCLIRQSYIDNDCHWLVSLVGEWNTSFENISLIHIYL